MGIRPKNKRSFSEIFLCLAKNRFSKFNNLAKCKGNKIKEFFIPGQVNCSIYVYIDKYNLYLLTVIYYMLYIYTVFIIIISNGDIVVFRS